jgi:uncharacterized membrane protein (UPF0127 family)
LKPNLFNTGLNESPVPERKLVLSIMMVSCAVVLSALLILALWPSPESTVTFGTAEGDVDFRCEVADTPSERSLGLMNRESLPADAGMLFLFDEPAIQTFWMKNTLIPLDIVFMDENGQVINIEQALPEPGIPDNELTRYPSERPAPWVVELNMGACAANGICPGIMASYVIN